MEEQLVTAQLGRLKQLETIASTPAQRSAVRSASRRLLAAAADAGWPQKTLARAGGMDPDTARRRQRLARSEASGPWGLDIDPPPAPVQPPAPPPLFLTPAEALAHAGVARNRLYQWRAAGLLPHTRLHPSGRTWLYSRADLDRLIALRGGGKILPAHLPAAAADPAVGATQTLSPPPIGPNRPPTS